MSMSVSCKEKTLRKIKFDAHRLWSSYVCALKQKRVAMSLAFSCGRRGTAIAVDEEFLDIKKI